MTAPGPLPPRDEPPPMSAALPLSRFKVLDLTYFRAGPNCARQLADWGAEVVKVELPAALDDGRSGVREGSDYQNTHRNKQGITLDLKNPAGRALFERLVAGADVLVENFRPAVKHRLGIGPAALERINPRLVYGSISGFGQAGPDADRAGLDQIIQGEGGLMSITGLPGQGPLRVGTAVGDLCAGLFLAQGILIALLERERSGRGQWVHTSLIESMIAMLDFQATRWLIDGEVPPQAGNDHPTHIPTGVFRTADGHINVAASGDRLYDRLCRAVGRPELIDDPRFATSPQRSLNRAALSAALAARTSAAWIEALNAAGVPCGPILTVDQVFADPQVRHLGMAQAVTDGEAPPQTLVAHPVSTEAGRNPLRHRAPKPGEHNEAVYGALGLSPEEIARLRRENVI